MSIIYNRSHPAFASNFDRAAERMLTANRNAAVTAVQVERNEPPAAYLVTYREVTKSGQPKRCTFASLDPYPPDIGPDDDAETRVLISAVPLYTREN